MTPARARRDPAVRICVYTYLLGAYDQLLDQPVASDSDADFICFTDDPGLRSDTWRIELVDPRYPTDVVRSARALKILGHPVLDAYEVTVCIDASVLLRAAPEQIVAAWLTDDVDLALPQHSYREQVLDEFDEVIRLNYDDRARVHEQLLSYSVSDPDALTQKPLWTAIMVRRRTPAVAETMRLWFDHVLRYSRRDQLSVNVAIARTRLAARRVPLDNFSSELHLWPAIEGRKVSLGKASPYSSGPLVAELRRARRQLAEVDAQLVGLGIGGVADLADTLNVLRTQAARGEADRARVEEISREAVQWRERWASVQGITGATGNLVRAFRGALTRHSR